MIKAYCGYIKSGELLTNSASGGAATAMAITIIQQGGVVYGASYTADFKNAEYIRVDKIDNIWKLQGSKYIKAQVGKILSALERDLQCEKTVLFIGLPCDVGVIKKYCENKHVNTVKLLLIDLICHGPTMSKVADIYISHLEKRFHSSIKYFSVRYKNPYWNPPYLFAQFENGKKYCKEFYKTDYGVAFSLMQMEGCYNCKFKGENHVSDVTIGDYWGLDEKDEVYNKFGTSILFVHNEKGNKFVCSLDNFELFDAEIEKALRGNPRYSLPVAKTHRTEVFKTRFEEKGLSYAVSKELGFWKNLIRKMPSSVINFLKRFLNRGVVKHE